MKTNYQMLLDFEPFKFQKWGFINKNETEIVKKNFKIEERTDIELQNLRDFVVMYFSLCNWLWIMYVVKKKIKTY